MESDKIPEIAESSLGNDGKRTVAMVDFSAGASAPPHYHTDYSETFELIKGGMTVMLAADMNVENLKPIQLEPGKPVTIPINTLHAFKVTENQTQVRITFEPGSLGWEKIILIMQGATRDGIFHKFSSSETEAGAPFLSILGEFSNTIFVGEAFDQIEAYRSQNGTQIDSLKADLVAKYATEAHLKKAAAGL